MLTVLLSSCGVQIQMTTLSASSAGLSSGTPLCVRNSSWGYTGEMLANAFRERISADGFFLLRYEGSGSVILELREVYVEDPPPPGYRPSHYYDKKKHKHHKDDHYPPPPSPKLNATVVVRSGGTSYYHRSYREYVSIDYDGRMDLRDACRDMAASAMRDLTPHAVTYSEYVDPDDNIPALEQAARACAAGNWTLGRQYATPLLTQYPHCAEAYYLMGLIERHDGDFDASNDYFRQAHRMKPDSKYNSAIRDNENMRRTESIARQQMNI